MRIEDVIKGLSKFRVIESNNNLDSVTESKLELKLRLLKCMSDKADEELKE